MASCNCMGGPSCCKNRPELKFEVVIDPRITRFIEKLNELSALIDSRERPVFKLSDMRIMEIRD